jgi:hypothetical protein
MKHCVHVVDFLFQIMNFSSVVIQGAELFFMGQARDEGNVFSVKEKKLPLFRNN